MTKVKILKGIKEFIFLSEDLQNLWSNVLPELKNLDGYIKPKIFYNFYK